MLIWIYHYLLNGIGLDLDLGNSFWIQKILYFWYLTTLIFGFPHNIWSREIELDCIWTILLDIINYTKEWGNIRDVLFVYVTMRCNTQSCIKSTVMWMEISSCTKTVIQESLHTFVTAALLSLPLTTSPCLIKAIQVQ